MKRNKHIVIIGAGPGGLASAMLLCAKGYRVSVYETQPVLGGRNARLEMGDFSFDTGPTFLMMKPILDELFTLAKRQSEDYLRFIRLDPMYRLLLKDKTLLMTDDPVRMKSEIEKNFPGESGGFDTFKTKEAIRFKHLFPCLQQNYSSLHSMLSPSLFKALPYISLGKTVYEQLGSYFSQEDLKMAFTFQAKYLGMSAWHCPALFTMLPFIEHHMGIYHVSGGLNRISQAMADVIKEYGGQIYLNTPVKCLLKKGKQITAVQLEDKTEITADAFIINADFAHAMTHLFPEGDLKKYTRKKVDSLDYSCSTFMLYLGLDTVYKNTPHHNIIFAKDYHQNVRHIFEEKILSQDCSVYLHNPSVTDPSLAPAGKSSVYVLVPVPNSTASIDWAQQTQPMRKRILDIIEQRTEMKDLRRHIVAEKIITPQDWQQQHLVYNAATFNLAHGLNQMLYLRPHNRFEEASNCYIVGGGTHPGSGLPTIYESAKISTGLLEQDV